VELYAELRKVCKVILPDEEQDLPGLSSRKTTVAAKVAIGFNVPIDMLDAAPGTLAEGAGRVNY
jgi:hypothetical protein